MGPVCIIRRFLQFNETRVVNNWIPSSLPDLANLSCLIHEIFGTERQLGCALGFNSLSTLSEPFIDGAGRRRPLHPGLVFSCGEDARRRRNAELFRRQLLSQRLLLFLCGRQFRRRNGSIAVVLGVGSGRRTIGAAFVFEAHSSPISTTPIARQRIGPKFSLLFKVNTTWHKSSDAQHK